MDINYKLLSNKRVCSCCNLAKRILVLYQWLCLTSFNHDNSNCGVPQGSLFGLVPFSGSTSDIPYINVYEQCSLGNL